MSAAIANIAREPARRVMPHNLDAEASILGGVIIRNESLLDLQAVEIDDFYLHQHKVVWEAIRNLEVARKPIDVVTLEAEIDRKGKLDAIGGIAFLGELTLRVPTADNVIAYRDIVRRLSANRRAILALADALDNAYTWPHDPAELVLETAGRLQRIEEIASPKRVKLIDVGMALAELQQLATAPIYTTPFETINSNIGFGGLLGTQVYTLAAGTGRGKTSFVSSLARHVAGNDSEPTPVLVASWEMKPGYFVARAAAGAVGVHSNEILRCTTDMGRVLRVMPRTRFFMLHKPSLADLRVGVDMLAQRFGKPPLLVVDYLSKLAQAIARKQQRPDPRMAMTEASEALTDLADRSAAAVLAVAAIGRHNNKRTSNPRELDPYELVDVAKESGDVEYDGAGLIVLSLSKEYTDDGRVATITLAKTRFGNELHIDARYDGRRGTWFDFGPVVESPDNTEQVQAIRDAIARVVKRIGPSSKNKIAEGVGRNRNMVLCEIDEMVKPGLGQLVWIGKKYGLPEHLIEAQPALPQPVSESKP